MKTVGRRVPRKDWRAANALLKLVIELRGGKPFIPKGVHKFRTFVEAQEWTLKMMTRKASK